MSNDKNNQMTDSELEALVSKLAPKNLGLDQNFKQELQVRLHSEINKQNKSIINFNFMNKFKYALFAVGAVAIVALILFTLPKDQGSVLLPGTQQITRVDDKAFGSLATLAVAGDRGQGGGGNALVAPEASTGTKLAAPVPSGMGGGGVGGSPDAMIFAPTYFSFVYKGDEFTIDSDKMPVYEREKGFGTAINLDSVLNNFSVGSFNIGKFNSARMDYITATQDQDKGYTLNMDFREGNVYIGQNWERWPNIYATCADQRCYEQNRVTEDQLPGNEEAINLANQFLDEYGIDKNGFGPPMVQDMWRMDYARAADKMMYYIPEVVTVIYPTKIEGNEIYDQSGGKTGMYVSVDARSKKVSGVSELNSQRYQSSDYETEKDTKRILGLAEKGGYQGYYQTLGDDVKKEEVELGTPIRGYVRLWQNMNNQSKELFVPSMIFPIINAPDNIYMRNVVVPIVKEVLDAQDKQPIPVPMEKPLR